MDLSGDEIARLIESADDDWDRPAPPDPDDYCGTCGKPLNRCNAWNNGDHNWQDLL